MDYVLFGIQGSGKGTQGKILAERIDAAYFETGGELRRLSSDGSELGKKVKSIIEAGHLVPNEVVMEIVENFVQHNSDKKIIFDGIPRNREQDESLRAVFLKHNRAYTGIYFELSRDEAEKRLLKRRICMKCKTVYPAFYTNEKCDKCGGDLHTRSDDNEASINTRIEIFYKETVLVVDAWKKAGTIISLNAAGTIEQVTQELFEKIRI